jgi:nucleotidyltransferase AbiEii toxin of type IV toxin-antitoxin system
VRITHHEQQAWHGEVVSSATEAALCALRDAQLLNEFYLAGGTGLALQFGHRLSHDLDFLAPQHFDEDALLQRIQILPEFALAAKAPYTLHATIQSTKVSFLGYAYPILYPANQFKGVPVADARDIACMKVSAIASHGTKRDFVDLYFCARRLGLGEIIQMSDTKYAQVHFSRIHILKSLTYFSDAEKDPMPNMLVSLDWETVKQFFLMETPRML